MDDDTDDFTLIENMEGFVSIFSDEYEYLLTPEEIERFF